jgi:uncharacterized damage-inducible protein DinB
LLDAWRVNNSVNLEMLALVKDEHLEFKPGKGKTIRSNFVHIIGFRRAWVESAVKKEAEVIPKLDWKTATIDEIRAGLEVSSEAMVALLRRFAEKPGRRPVTLFFAYAIAHEANHRAQIELALRLNGAEPSDAELYRLWEWQKQ